MNSLAIYHAAARGLLTAEQSPLTAGPILWAVCSADRGHCAVGAHAVSCLYRHRFIGRRYATQLLPRDGIQVLERVVLGPDRNLMVVRVKDRVLLLGVTAHHISQLAELDAAHYAGLPAPSQNGDRFATLLRESIGFGIGSDKPPTRKE